MNRARFVAVSSLALLLVAARGATAADVKPVANDAAALFDRLDANHDGQLTADEIPAEKAGLFTRLLRLAGKPADGKLSRDEFVAQLKAVSDDHGADGAAAGPKPADKAATDKPNGDKPAAAKPDGANPAANRPLIDPERMFARLDAKGTGKITLDDVPEQRRPLVKRIFAEAGKADGGSLTKDEFVKAVKALQAKRAAFGGPLGAKPAADGKPAESPAKLGAAGNAEQRLKRLLAQSKRPDGKLTKDDLPERLRDRFDKIDANHDGLIDPQELRDWFATVQRRLEAIQNK
jgi:Ca2+-binding EF-hand superfamily protein